MMRWYALSFQGDAKVTFFPFIMLIAALFARSKKRAKSAVMSRAYVMAQHFMPGEGPRPDRANHALFMNRYDADLVRDGDTWRISRLTIDNAWFEGDPTML